MSIFVLELFKRPAFFIITALVVLFSVCLHEYFHALFALLLGDDTAARRGHLSMNPLKQMGIWALIVFLLLGFTWGMVPVDTQKLRARHKWAPMAVSLAGPLANLLLAIVGWCLFGYLSVQGRAFHPYIMNFVYIFGTLNIVLCIFNLIPIPGLDGWNAIMSWFPNARIFSTETMKGVMLFLIFVAMFSVSYIFQFANLVMEMAPLQFSRVNVSESAFEGSLDQLACPLHEMFWKAESNVIFSVCSRKKVSNLLYELASMSPEMRAVKNPAFTGSMKNACTAKCGDAGFIFVLENNSAVAYRLEWSDGRWFLSDVNDFEPMLKVFNEMRCATTNPENVGSTQAQKKLAAHAAEIIERAFRFQASGTHEEWDALQPHLCIFLALEKINRVESLAGCDFKAKCTDMRFSDNNNNAELTFQVTVIAPHHQTQTIKAKYKFEYYPDRGWVLGV